MPVEPTIKHPNERDHDVWMQFFTAALSTAMTAKVHEGGPASIAEICAEIADAALDQERQRRRRSRGTAA
jgi:hypothetical protein